MAKKSKSKVKAQKAGIGFSVAGVLASINKKTMERNQEKIEQRVSAMVTSLAKREAETDHYRGRVDKMLAGLGAVKNAAQLERWFDKGF